MKQTTGASMRGESPCILYNFFYPAIWIIKNIQNRRKQHKYRSYSRRPFYLCPLTQLNRVPCNLSPHEFYVKLANLKNKHKPYTAPYILDDILKQNTHTTCSTLLGGL